MGKQVDEQFWQNSGEKEKLQTVNFIPVCWTGAKAIFYLPFNRIFRKPLVNGKQLTSTHTVYD